MDEQMDPVKCVYVHSLDDDADADDVIFGKLKQIDAENEKVYSVCLLKITHRCLIASKVQIFCTEQFCLAKDRCRHFRISLYVCKV